MATNRPKIWFFYRMESADPRYYVPSNAAPPQSLGQNAGWKVILYVDDRELNNSHKSKNMTRDQLIRQIRDRVQTCQRPQDPLAEVVCKRLAAGDYLFAARNIITGQEIVLDCCIERKTISDMLRCITEPNEGFTAFSKIETQFRKLRCCGVSSPTILLEGPRRHYPKHVETLSGQIEGNVHTPFSLKRTNNVHETVDWLVEKHLEMQRRLPMAHKRTYEDFRTSVDKAMKCPTLLFFVSLMEVEGVGAVSADAIVKRFQTEAGLQTAFQQYRHGEIRACLLGRKRSKDEIMVELEQEFGPPANPSVAAAPIRNHDPSRETAARLAPQNHRGVAAAPVRNHDTSRGTAARLAPPNGRRVHEASVARAAPRPEIIDLTGDGDVRGQPDASSRSSKRARSMERWPDIEQHARRTNEHDRAATSAAATMREVEYWRCRFCSFEWNEEECLYCRNCHQCCVTL